MSEFSRDMEDRSQGNQLKKIARSLDGIAFWWWMFVMFYIAMRLGTALANLY